MPQFPVGAEVTANTQGFVTGFGAASKELSKFRNGLGLASAGLVTFAGAAGLGAAADAAADFQEQLRQIHTLVGINQDTIAAWGKEVLDIAQEVGKSPLELAESLERTTSAGIESAEALEVVEAAARGSALGMGRMEDISKVAAAALIAFGDSGLTAEEAVDQLFRAVRAGAAEPDTMASAMGRVIGVADQMGVSFAEASGFISTFTRLGVSAEQAATSLQATLSNFLKPTQQTRDALEELGTSVDEVRAMIDEQGLSTALITLMETFDGNLDLLGQVIPNVRALRGVLGTAGSQAEAFVEVEKEIAEGAATINTEFEKLTDDLNHNLDKMGAKFETELIKIGQDLLPPVTEGVKLLTASMDELIVVAGALTFAAAVNGLTRLTTGLGRAALAAGGFRTALTGVVGFLGGPWTAALTVAAGAVPFLVSALKDTEDQAKSTRRELEELGPAIADILGNGPAILREMGKLRMDEETRLERMRRLQGTIRLQEEGRIRVSEDIIESHRNELDQLQRKQERLERLERAWISHANAAELFGDEVEEAGQDVEGTATELEEMNRIIDQMGRSTDDLVERLRAEADQARFTRRELIHKSDAYQEASPLMQQHIDWLLDIIEANREEAESAREAEEAERGLVEVLEDRLAQAKFSWQELIQMSEEFQELSEEERERANDLIEQITEITTAARDADRLARTISRGLFDIADGTVAVGEGFKDMVDSILEDLLRLVIRQSITEPLAKAISTGLGSLLDGLDMLGAGDTEGMAFGGRVKGGRPYIVGELGRPELFVPEASGHIIPLGAGPGGQGMGGSQTIVQQTVMFAPNLIDGRSGQRFIRENAGEIARIVGEGVRQSDSFARTLRGG